MLDEIAGGARKDPRSSAAGSAPDPFLTASRCVPAVPERFPPAGTAPRLGPSGPRAAGPVRLLLGPPLGLLRRFPPKPPVRCPAWPVRARQPPRQPASAGRGPRPWPGRILGAAARGGLAPPRRRARPPAGPSTAQTRLTGPAGPEGGCVVSERIGPPTRPSPWAGETLAAASRRPRWCVESASGTPGSHLNRGPRAPGGSVRPRRPRFFAAAAAPVERFPAARGRQGSEPPGGARSAPTGSGRLLARTRDDWRSDTEHPRWCAVGRRGRTGQRCLGNALASPLRTHGGKPHEHRSP